MDESLYITFAKGGSLQSAWAPLYVFHYRILSFFFNDTVQMYYFNWALITCSLPLLHFILLRRLQANALISYLSAFYILVASFNSPLSSKPAHFNMLFLYLSLIFASLFVSRLRALSVLLPLLLLCAFIRQDMVIPLMFVGLYYAHTAWKYRREWGPKAGYPLLFLGLSAAIAFSSFGSPFREDRSWQVFSDTFYFNRAAKHPTLAKVQILTKYFGDAQSVSQAVLKNPKAVLEHISINLAKLTRTLYPALHLHFPLFNKVEPSLEAVCTRENLLLLSALAAMVFFSSFMRIRWNDWRFGVVTHFEKIFLVIFAGILAKNAVTALVFTSEFARYYLEFFFFSALMGALLISRLWPMQLRALPLALLALPLTAATPSHRDCEGCKKMQALTSAQSVKEVVLYVRGLNLPGNRNCLIFGCFGVHLGEKFQCVAAGTTSYPGPGPEPSHRDLRSFIFEKRIDTVLVSDDMFEEMERLGKGSEFRDLLKNYKFYGFDAIHRLSHGHYVITKNQ